MYNDSAALQQVMLWCRVWHCTVAWTNEWLWVIDDQIRNVLSDSAKKSSSVYIRFLRVTVNNTHRYPKLRLISKIKLSIESCVGHTYVCDYEVGCRIVALKSWYLYNKFPTQYPGYHLLFGDWGWDKTHTTDSYRLFHGPWSGLVVSIHCYFDDCRMLAYSIMACEVCIIWRKPIVTCKSQYHLASQRLAALQWSHQYIQLDFFTAHDACQRAY